MQIMCSILICQCGCQLNKRIASSGLYAQPMPLQGAERSSTQPLAQRNNERFVRNHNNIDKIEQKPKIRLDEVTLMRTILALLIVFMHVVFGVMFQLL